jgi:CubicO group peptidase (beta-lactamase class C family)
MQNRMHVMIEALMLPGSACDRLRVRSTMRQFRFGINRKTSACALLALVALMGAAIPALSESVIAQGVVVAQGVVAPASAKLAQKTQANAPAAPVAAAAIPPASPGATAVSPAVGAVPTDAPASMPAPRAIDSADLSAYVDGLVEAGMKRDGIAGVAVAVVDRQGTLLLRGYGIAHASGTPVRPDRTLFRIASISKTFTYLLGLKLVDEGRLRLDAPVNDYLPAELKLPEDGFRPVLVRHLFTHSAGYEDSAMGHLFTDRGEALPTLEDYLVEHRPERVREPGVHAVYSNYSVALLGAIAARIEGVDFETLVERELLQPMRMPLTTFREPLPARDPRHAPERFRGMWSQGFQRSGGGFAPQQFEHIAQIAPAGGASATAADMTRYLRMLLDRGELDGVRVLSPTAYARLAGEPLFRNAPGGTGFAYGYFKRRYGQVESLEHGGATSWFHSNFVAVPALGVGVFVSTNTNTGRKFAAELPEKIFARYFPAARASALPKPAPKFDAARFVGRYFSERGNFRSAEKLILNTPATIAAADGGLVLITNGDSTRWLPEDADGLRFREAEGQGRIVFFADAAGRIAGFAGAGGHNVFARAGVFERIDLLPTLLGVPVALGLLALIGAFLRRFGKHREPHRQKHREHAETRRVGFWLYVAAAIWLLFGMSLGYALLRFTADPTEAFYRYPGRWLPIALWVSPLALAATAWCLWRLPRAWRNRDWTLWRKSRHTLVVASFVLAAWTVWSWNLVGWKL